MGKCENVSSTKLISTAVCSAIIASTIPAFAYEIVPETIEEMTDEAIMVLHISAVRAEVLEIPEGPCGYVYKARVNEVLKGEELDEVEFYSPFYAGNISLGLDTIVFLLDAKIAQRGGAFAHLTEDESSDRKQFLKQCEAVAPQYSENTHATIRYTIARTYPDSEALYRGKTDQDIRAWHDQHLMVELSDDTDVANLEDVRRISVKTVTVNHEDIDVSDIGHRWLTPWRFRDSATLLPASRVKALIKARASASGE
jgi:hypothetical protein